MSDDESGWGEVDTDEDRKQMRVKDSVRSYMAHRAEATGNTYSEEAAQWLPEPSEDTVLSFEEEDIVRFKATPEIHGRIKDLAGKNVTVGEVLAYYALKDALEQGNLDAAADMAEEVPELLWKALDSPGDAA